MKSVLIRNANIVNEGQVQPGHVLVQQGRIAKISSQAIDQKADIEIDAGGEAYLMPGLIDDQVHFREPGLTHKGEIATESRAAVAGGVTSYMEMPNTVPQALTQELLDQKYQRAAQVSLANYSFFMGASNDNIDEVLKTDPKTVCGVKVFMGSSTGNMLVDDEKTLEGIFSRCPMLIATHCEDEATIRANVEHYHQEYGEDVPIRMHPLIRSEEACYRSSSKAVALAKKYGTRLHILHISTAKELALFDNTLPLEEKKITAEACIHHLWFSQEDYDSKGTFIKWNPAVKRAEDRDAIWQAILNGTIDVVATDHAPHTLEEKQQTYFKAPSGGPLVQHSLVAMMEKWHQGQITLPHIVQLMAHNVARMFNIHQRGYIREDYWADLVLVHPQKPWTVSKPNILAKCGWSPFEGQTFQSQISHTIVSGHLAYANGQIIEGPMGQRMLFDR